MPSYYPPRNDNARAAFLKTALASAKNDYEKGNTYILEDTFNTLKNFAPSFEEKVTTINQKLSNRSKELDEGNSALNALATYMRDVFEAVRRQVNRLNLPSHVITLYGLPLDGTTPNPSTATEWLTIARRFLEGTKEIEEQGFPVVSCPSPDEIKDVFKKAEKEYADVSAADRSYDETQAEIAESRKVADELISDIMAELRLTLRKMDNPSQRRVQRSYGARFKYLQGEEVDTDDLEPVTEE
jgi:hypothetical protein